MSHPRERRLTSNRNVVGVATSWDCHVGRALVDPCDADFRNGAKQAAGFLIGQAMRASQGLANPKLLAELLKSKLA
jgi:hypothetical protein